MQIKTLTLHRVGNKLNEEGIIYSDSLININQQVRTQLTKYFSASIKANEYYHLYHEHKLSLNEIYTYASEMFQEKKLLLNESKKIADFLYRKSEHPQIKSGDLFIVYFTNCTLEEQNVDAIGIFKAESNDTFIKISQTETGFSIDTETGFSVNKLDKGCIIYNTEKNNGYVVSIIDSSNKAGLEARYWKDDFLYVKEIKDSSYHTNTMIDLCKKFTTEYLAEKVQATNVDQIDLLNKTINYFKDSSIFKIEEFESKVLKDKETEKHFKNYIQLYEEEKQTPIKESFEISPSVVKKQNRLLKNTIKLDDNFKIMIDGNRNLLKKGYDEETGMSYYILYFKEES